MLCASRTRGTPRFADLGLPDTSNCAQLVVETVEKAKGVFFWVFLMKSNVLDLRRRLRLIPADLMDYFKQMVGTLDTFYLSQASKLSK
jgi:hypothetical protein